MTDSNQMLLTNTNAAPNEKQKKFMDWEFGAFFHFGIRTFYEVMRDWDMKPMAVEGFCPSDLNCDDWCESVKTAGAKYAVMTAKHHDGFANWPSKYTDYSVAATKWKDGKGDVVREFTDACRRHGLGVGLYYSPAQYDSVDWTAQEYNDYFVNQISELLTNYGKIDYLWFDGCGSGGHEWDTARIIRVIRQLQPDILLFGMWDPDTTWCGNEEGYGRYPNVYFRDGRFLPDECDCRIREQWFWSDSDFDQLKSVDTLMGIYELSVGRGSNLLLNVGPDRRGRICDEDKKRLAEMGAELRRREQCAVSEEIPCENGEVFFEFYDKKGSPEWVNAIVLREDLSAGQNVTAVRVIYPGDMTNAILWQGTTIGRKLIIRFPQVYMRRLRVEIETQNGENAKVIGQAFRY